MKAEGPFTVGSLIEALKRFPDDLPVKLNFVDLNGLQNRLLSSTIADIADLCEDDFECKIYTLYHIAEVRSIEATENGKGEKFLLMTECQSAEDERDFDAYL